MGVVLFLLGRFFLECHCRIKEETMKSLEELGEVISTDVLVLGGGMAGLCAEIKSRETGEDVLAVEKGGVDWAG
jgi:heterodisulfide reductase subunit A-like polyferredoxin